MILDIEPVRDEDEKREHHAHKDSSFGGTMIAILCVVLLIACGTTFGIGYAVGHYYAPSSSDASVQNAAVTTSPSAVIPQAAAGATKGSLGLIDSSSQMSGVSKPDVTTASANTPAAMLQSKPVVAQPAPAKPSAAQIAKSKPSPSISTKHSPSHPVEYAHRSSPARGADPFSRMISNPNYGADTSSSSSHQPMVQVAVLTRDEDASVLIDALNRHGFSATANRESDHRIHIRLGPFSSRTDASAMRDKLLNDGYNAVVQ